MKAQYERIVDEIYEKYGDRPDFPWSEYPDYEVFRHAQNKKWYGLVMNIPPKRLYAKDISEKFRIPDSVAAKNDIHILDLKLPPAQVADLDSKERIFPAYHMNAGHWISVLLEDVLSDNFIMELVDRSYNITKNEK